MNDVKQQYWFRAKRYGLGWGLPLAWQGWVFFCSWLVLFPSGLLFLTPGNKPARWAFIATMVGLFLLVCFVKGDPQGRRWQNGGKS